MVGATESFGLLGPNGAGKTTTLRMMQGEGQRDVLQHDVYTPLLPPLLQNTPPSFFPQLVSASAAAHSQPYAMSSAFHRHAGA